MSSGGIMRLLIGLIALAAITANLFIASLAWANVDLLFFRARSGPDLITLEWETATELDNLGFNLYRNEMGCRDPNGNPHSSPLNETLIPSQVGGQPVGAFYEFTDENVVASVSYTYWLEDVDFFGVETCHGPTLAAATGADPLPTSASGNNTPAPTATYTPLPTRTPTSTSVPATSQSAPPTPSAANTPTTTPTVSPPASATVVNQSQQSQPTAAVPTAGADLATPVPPVTSQETGEVRNSQLEFDGSAGAGEQLQPFPESTVISSGAPAILQGTAFDRNELDARVISARKIGEDEAATKEPATEMASARPDNRNSTLAIMMILSGSVLAIGGAITSWLLLKQPNDLSSRTW